MSFIGKYIYNKTEKNLLNWLSKYFAFMMQLGHSWREQSDKKQSLLHNCLHGINSKTSAYSIDDMHKMLGGRD